MSFMLSCVKDKDGQTLLASCPFSKGFLMCVNSCAIFVPHRETIEGETCTDYRWGHCGLAGDNGQLLHAVDEDTEDKLRERRGAAWTA